jgi:asparagine synthase (glutamine-hydrolysing)
MEMLPREGKVQARAAEHGLRVMLSGWGGDEAVSARPGGGLSGFFARRQWNEFRAVAGFRMEVADDSGISKALHRVKKIGGVARDIVVPRLPDSVFDRFFYDVWLRHRNNCAQPLFARLHRRAIKALRGPAFRPQPDIRQTISHLLEYGHIAQRLEHWATSGARHRLVYRYPLLDRRLVEFALAIPAIQHCRTKAHLPIFLRSVAELMPATRDWSQRKAESITLEALRKARFSAYKEWAWRQADAAHSQRARFVEPELMIQAVRRAGRSDKMSALSGVREAFACYAFEKSAPHL